MHDLNETAKTICEHLRANGFLADAGIGQALNLAEEAGELVAAYRRWTGRARRGGSEQDVRAELSDVVITAYVAAADMNERLFEGGRVRRVMYRVEPAEAWPHVLAVFSVVNTFVNAWLDPTSGSQLSALSMVVDYAYHLAAVLGWNLDKDIDAKLVKVFSRGWREPALEGESRG